jgi:hypothetical protein
MEPITAAICVQRFRRNFIRPSVSGSALPGSSHSALLV